MPSSFLRLFRYARAEKIDAKENFTTEALAANIRYSSAPILDVLRSREILPRDARVVDTGVFTQVHFPATGFIDLVLEFEIEDPVRSVRTLWIEVKVDASEHGQQLTNYLRYIKDRPEITLLTLGKHPLRDDVQHITWREIRRAALESGAAHWKDFATFLEEIGMADDFDGPLIDQEVASLGSSFSLLRKMAHTLEPVSRYANMAWPQSAWPETHDDIVKALGEQFRKFGRLTLFSRYARSPAWVVLGIVPDSHDGRRGYLEAWVEARPKDLATRASLDAAYRAQPLPTLWTRPKEGWFVFRAREVVPANGSPELIQAWFNARLDELYASNIFTKIVDLTKTAPTADDGDGED